MDISAEQTFAQCSQNKINPDYSSLYQYCKISRLPSNIQTSNERSQSYHGISMTQKYTFYTVYKRLISVFLGTTDLSL